MPPNRDLAKRHKVNYLVLLTLIRHPACNKKVRKISKSFFAKFRNYQGGATNFNGWVPWTRLANLGE